MRYIADRGELVMQHIVLVVRKIVATAGWRGNELSLSGFNTRFLLQSHVLFPFYLISFKEDWIAYISPRASNQNRFGIVAQQRVESQTAFHVFQFFSYILENVFRSFQPGLFQRQTTFARHWYTQVAISERPTTILRANIYATVI